MLSPRKISKFFISACLFPAVISVAIAAAEQPEADAQKYPPPQELLSSTAGQSQEVLKQYVLPEHDRLIGDIDAARANIQRELDGIGSDPYVRRRRFSAAERAALHNEMQRLDTIKAHANKNREDLIQGKGPYAELFNMPQLTASQVSSAAQSTWSLVKDARANPKNATEVNNNITPALNLASLTLPQGSHIKKGYGYIKGAQGFAKLNETGVIPASSWLGISTSMYDLAKKPTLDNYFGSVSSLAGALYAPQIFVLKSLVQGQAQIIDAQFKSLETLMNENTQQTGSQDKFSQYKTGYPVSKALKELEK